MGESKSSLCYFNLAGNNHIDFKLENIAFLLLSSLKIAHDSKYGIF